MHVNSHIVSPKLATIPNLRHGFFTRNGGVSKGVYSSLNCGLGSHDDRANVLQNRAYVAGVMGVAASKLVTVYQAHTIDCLTIETPFVGDAPKADALVTKIRGLALAVATADCTPILVCDPEAHVIGAIHAGWRGALAGIVQSTIEKMVEQGATPKKIIAAIGPTIRQKSYEVGSDVIDACTKIDPKNVQFFKPSQQEGFAMFDLPGFVAAQLTAAGVGNIDDTGHDTYADEAQFFSYRRMTHKKEPDYGRHLHAIVLE